MSIDCFAYFQLFGIQAISANLVHMDASKNVGGMACLLENFFFPLSPEILEHM